MSDKIRRDGIEDQIKGAGHELKGRVRNALGALTGDASEQIKGKAEEVAGKARRKIGEAKSDWGR